MEIIIVFVLTGIVAFSMGFSLGKPDILRNFKDMDTEEYLNIRYCGDCRKAYWFKI